MQTDLKYEQLKDDTCNLIELRSETNDRSSELSDYSITYQTLGILTSTHIHTLSLSLSHTHTHTYIFTFPHTWQILSVMNSRTTLRVRPQASSRLRLRGWE